MNWKDWIAAACVVLFVALTMALFLNGIAMVLSAVCPD